MVATTYGWAGTVNEVQFARINQLTQPQDYAKLTLTDWAVTPVASQRAVSVAPGTGGGLGTWTATDSAESVAIASTPTDGQWFLLVRNRVWATKLTGLVLRPHTTTSVTTPGPVPSTYPSTLKSNPGVEDDVPIAWVWASSANTTLVIVPILRPTRIIPRRGSTSQRDAFYGAPGTSASLQSGLAYAEWYNTDFEWQEVYLPARVSAGGVDVDRPAGWYPVAGSFPFLEADNNGTAQNVANATSPELPLALSRVASRGGFTTSTVNGGQAFTVPFAGRYAAHVFGQWAAGGTGSTGLRQLGVYVNGTPFSYGQVRNPPNGNVANDAGTGALVLPAGAVVDFRVYQSNGAALAFTTSRASISYLGPI